MDEAVAKKLNEFFGTYKIREYNKREIIIKPYDPPKGVYFLKSGLVKMYTISKKGEELILNIFKPNSFFPASWVVNESENLYFFETVNKVKLTIAPKDKTYIFLKDNPDIVFDLLQRLYKGLDGILTRMSYLMSGDAYSRLIAELIIEAKRFGTKPKNKQITLKMSERNLSEETGLTRETISREIKKLKAKKLIKLKGKKIVIENVDNLIEELLV